ncbi:MAG: septum formation initiator family protein [Rikenellaceae bacterium]
MATKKRRNIRIITNTNIIIVSSAIFIAIMYFSDDNNYFVRKQLREKHAVLVGQVDSLRQKISRDSLNLERIKKDDKFLEKFAREHFYMYREGEEVFAVE